MARPIGPNMKKFVIRRMSVMAVPAGEGLSSAIEFLMKPGALGSGFKQAMEWCDAAIAAIRGAGEPNPWKNATEEEIAGELVRRIEAKNVLSR